MSKNIVHSLFLVFVLMGVFGLAFRVQRVEAGGTIYIKADGSVEGTTYIVSDDNVTYAFTADIGDSIVVERSNIIVDGVGHTLDGLGSLLYGFNLTSVSNVTIRNVNVMGFGYGIYLQLSILNIILENNITFNEGNIYLGNSSDNMITDNTITDGAEAIQLYASSNNTISGNRMMRNYVGVWSRFNSAENVISENNITNSNSWGVSIESSSDNTILNNNMENNFAGISLSHSSGHEITLNNIIGTSMGSHGISLILSSNNTILGNNVTNNHDRGIYIHLSSNNNISKNKVANNGQNGIDLVSDSNFNIVSGNNVIDNAIDGIHLTYSSNNTICHNNFIDNGHPTGISEDPEFNIWDNGIEGNYYSDYTGVDSNHDGIGDSHYIIHTNNTDHYPLMGPFHSFNTSIGEYVSVVSNSTVTYFNYEESKGWIIIQVRNATAEQAFGFCRVCIPHNLIDPDVTWIHVVINDGTVTPLHFNNTLYDNGTHRWIYVAYPHSLVEIVIVPEFPSFLVLPLFMIATLLAVIVYRRKHTM